jgi:hypothetical protein
MNTEDQIKQITQAKKRGFVPGDSYFRDGTRMVEITPGTFVNEAKASELGVKPKPSTSHTQIPAGGSSGTSMRT